MRIKEKHKNKLLVEGNDDQHILWALCEKHSITENFDVIDCKGYNKLLEEIRVRFKQSELSSLGIIVDADFEFLSRCESIKNKLVEIGFNEIPKVFPKEGLILSNEENKKVGVWIMPNNSFEGKVEDFVKYLIPNEDKLLPFVEHHLSEIENNKLDKYKEKDKPKALIHSWLAVQEAPGSPMGAAITKKYFSTDNEICSQFVNWLKRLFEEN